MRNPQLRYLRNMGLCVAIPLAASMLMNLLVDPYGAYRLLDTSSLDAFRSDQYVAAAERFRHSKASVVVVGSSRVVDGIRDQKEDSTGKTICKVAVRGTAWREQHGILQHLIESPQRPETIVFGFDLDTVLRKSRPSDFEQSRFCPSLSQVDYHAQNLLSAHALSQSIGLVRSRISGKPSQTDIHDIVSHQGSHQVFRQQLAKDIPMHDPETATKRVSVCVKELGQLAQQAKANGVTIKVVLLPVHALSYEKLIRLGYGTCVTNLKRELATECSARTTPLWDFTGYSLVTTEPVPTPADPNKTMQWFYDSDHFTPQLGDIVLRRIIEQTGSVGAPSQIGERLSAQNIESHLAKVQRDRVRYLSSDPEELKLLKMKSTDPNKTGFRPFASTETAMATGDSRTRRSVAAR